jgi:phosphoribosylformylglycinamidine cyclo-ligase
VSVARGNLFARKVGALARRTHIAGVVGGIGGFSGVFDPSRYRGGHPLLVATTDGVGTKLDVAQAAGDHTTVGIDLVAMCVNDLICTGARPLFFLDYFACGRLDLRKAQQVMRGIVAGCKEAGCALIGGETAEMPGFYPQGRYDLAGFAVGLVARRDKLDGCSTRAGDLVIGLASSGFHSNGFSLLRRLFTQGEMRGRWGKVLLRPTRIYVRPVLNLNGRVRLKGIAHITGGAFRDKLARIIPNGLCAVIHRGSWPEPAECAEVRKRGRISDEEMFRTFNMGVGMAVVMAPEEVGRARRVLARHPLQNWVIGRIEKAARGHTRVRIR